MTWEYYNKNVLDKEKLNLAEKMGLDTSAKIDPRESQGFNMETVDKTRQDALTKAILDYRKNLPTPDNDGGRAENQTVKSVNLSPLVNVSPEEKFYQSLGLKYRGGYGATVKAKGRLLVAVVLVAGYFAYKKFKK
jgi:hypothetical protein